ncbi:MAG: hypothetical protein K6U14_03310 [Firmicutes bacterium]|nr:hypothetical protein [Alicyclobacillaceae bacterium]MCL6496647.1 hypothetical protein [Bacillota bacterium]
MGDSWVALTDDGRGGVCLECRALAIDPDLARFLRHQDPATWPQWIRLALAVGGAAVSGMGNTALPAWWVALLEGEDPREWLTRWAAERSEVAPWLDRWARHRDPDPRQVLREAVESLAQQLQQALLRRLEADGGS